MSEVLLPANPEAVEEMDPNDRSHALNRVHAAGISDTELIDAFHILLYETSARHITGLLSTKWLGYSMIKMPHDLFVMQELIWEHRPSLLIETGTYVGGSAIYFASVMDMFGHGKVLSIDINAVTTNYPTHPRVSYLGGRSSVDPAVLEDVERHVERADGGTVMVGLDSDHSTDHVLAELNAYAQFVTPGSWLIVEDTNLDKRPLIQTKGGLGRTDEPGPGLAVDQWLPNHPDFRVEERKGTRYLFSSNTWMRRLRT